MATYDSRGFPDAGPGLISTTTGRHLGTHGLTHAAGNSFPPEQYRQVLEHADMASQGNPAVYIHLPFCPSRCLSCDSVTTVNHDPGAVDRYLDHLEREIELVTQLAGRAQTLSQLHLGGGTPNYLSDPQLMRLMDIVEHYFTLSPDTMMSLDASARRSSYAQLQLLRGLGFRDIKFDVRDLNPGVQTAVGRADSLYLLQDVFATARETGVENIGMDLVYGLPHQSMETIITSLEQIRQLSPDRVSCHSFTRRTGLFSHHRSMDAATLPSLADRLVMFNAIVDFMQDDGYTWVGLDYFVKSDDPIAAAQDQHALYYNWIGYNLHGSPHMLGFGTSAVSEASSGVYTQNHMDIPDWQASVDRDELPVHRSIRFTDQQQRQRRALTNLLCNMELVDYTNVLEIEGGADELKRLENDGVIEVVENRAVVTPQGRYMLHHMLGGVAAYNPSPA